MGRVDCGKLLRLEGGEEGVETHPVDGAVLFAGAMGVEEVFAVG